MVKVKIVVARYNENMGWTKHFDNVLIYNKGKDDIPEYNPIKLPNVGREGHTYYQYIYDNYDNLEEYTAFLQGDPFTHSPNIINNLKNIINTHHFNDYFHFLSERVLDCNLSRCKYGPYSPNRIVYKYLFPNTMLSEDTTFYFGAGAQFIVSRETIRKKPREFYKKIIDILGYHTDPIEGHAIERLHKVIFDMNIYDHTY